MHSLSYASVLRRISAALDAAATVFVRFTPEAIETEYKAGHDPVTAADRALDAFPKKAWTTRSGCNGRAFWSSILWTEPVSLSKEFPNSAFRLGSWRREVRWQEESTIRPPAKLSSERSIPASPTTANLPRPASAPASGALRFLPAAVRSNAESGKRLRMRLFSIRPMGRQLTSLPWSGLGGCNVHSDSQNEWDAGPIRAPQPAPRALRVYSLVR